MMRKVMALSLIVLACCMAPSSAAGAHIDGVAIVNYGVYAVSGPEGKENQEKNWKLIKQGDRIPATIGTSFGMEYVIKGTPEGERITITLRYLHPTMTNPKTGEKYNSQDVSIPTLVGKKIHEGYTFDHEWELVSGAWVIQVFHDDRKLGEQYFIVYKP